MTGIYLPGALWRPVSYRAEAGGFATTPLGWILHVVVGNGSPWSTFEHAPAGSRRFSTAWVAKDGRAEQYTELTGKSWAQAAGNGAYWSFETEGYPTEPLTDAQITTLATWHNSLGAMDTLAEAPGQRGVGTHYMGGSAWGGHTCPDPVAGAGPRSRQRDAILARARELRAVTVANQISSTPSGPTITPPTAAPTPLQRKEPTMKVIRGADTPDVYISDGLWKRYVKDQSTIPDLLRMCDQAEVLVIGQYTIDRIPLLTTTPVDVAAITAAVVKALPASAAPLTAADVATELAKRLAS